MIAAIVFIIVVSMVGVSIEEKIETETPKIEINAAPITTRTIWSCQATRCNTVRKQIIE